MSIDQEEVDSQKEDQERVRESLVSLGCDHKTIAETMKLCDDLRHYGEFRKVIPKRESMQELKEVFESLGVMEKVTV